MSPSHAGYSVIELELGKLRCLRRGLLPPAVPRQLPSGHSSSPAPGRHAPGPGAPAATPAAQAIHRDRGPGHGRGSRGCPIMESRSDGACPGVMSRRDSRRAAAARRRRHRPGPGRHGDNRLLLCAELLPRAMIALRPDQPHQ